MERTMRGNVSRVNVLKGIEADRSSQQCSLAKQSCILLVTRNGRLTQPAMDYTVNVAERLACTVLVIYLNGLSFLADGGGHQGLVASMIGKNVAEFKEKAIARGVQCKFIQESGKISQVISRICRVVKRVEFVLLDQGIKIEEVSSGSPVPVFNIVCTDGQAGRVSRNRQERKKFYGDKNMEATNRKGHFLKTLIFGTMTAIFYAAVFSNSDFLMRYFTRGGLYALLPVATVFAFSYAHGSFTSNFWSALGIEGSKAATLKPTKVAEKRPDTRPRVHAGA